MPATVVLSLGGSIIAPDGVDHRFLTAFKCMIESYLESNADSRIIIVTGGGSPARVYQQAYRAIMSTHDQDTQDWIGIAATRLNGALVKALFPTYCIDELVTDPSASISFTGRLLIATGWKPGFSTDTDAVLLAERFEANTLVNLSNTAKVFTADLKIDKDAKPIDSIEWKAFRAIVGDTWTPGKNVPFDPVASALAERMKLTVICADGRNIENTRSILEGKPFTGTIIG